MTALQWTGLLLFTLLLVATGFMALWVADARRADHLATDPGRIRRPSTRRGKDYRAAHRARPHP